MSTQCMRNERCKENEKKNCRTRRPWQCVTVTACACVCVCVRLWMIVQRVKKMTVMMEESCNRGAEKTTNADGRAKRIRKSSEHNFDSWALFFLYVYTSDDALNMASNTHRTSRRSMHLQWMHVALAQICLCPVQLCNMVCGEPWCVGNEHSRVDIHKKEATTKTLQSLN